MMKFSETSEIVLTTAAALCAVTVFNAWVSPEVQKKPVRLSEVCTGNVWLFSVVSLVSDPVNLFVRHGTGQSLGDEEL